MPCGYDVRVRVEDGLKESPAVVVVVVNDRKNYVVLQQQQADTGAERPKMSQGKYSQWGMPCGKILVLYTKS